MSGRVLRPKSGRRRDLARPPGAGQGSVLRRHQMLRVRGRSVAWAPPLLLLGGIALVDLNTSGQFRIISWIVLVPGIAAAICGVPGTAVFAALGLVTVARAVAADPHLTEPRLLVAFVRDGTPRHCGGRLADDTTVFAVRRAAEGMPVQGRLQS